MRYLCLQNNNLHNVPQKRTTTVILIYTPKSTPARVLNIT